VNSCDDPHQTKGKFLRSGSGLDGAGNSDVCLQAVLSVGRGMGLSRNGHLDRSADGMDFIAV